MSFLINNNMYKMKTNILQMFKLEIRQGITLKLKNGFNMGQRIETHLRSLSRK